MEDLDIIRHDIQPGLAARPSDFRGPPDPGRGAAGLMSYDIQIFRESAAGLQSIIYKIITS